MSNIGNEGLQVYVSGHALLPGTPCEVALKWDGDVAVLSFRVPVEPCKAGRFQTVQVQKPNGKIHDSHLMRSRVLNAEPVEGCPMDEDMRSHTDPPSASGGDV